MLVSTLLDFLLPGEAGEEERKMFLTLLSPGSQRMVPSSQRVRMQAFYLLSLREVGKGQAFYSQLSTGAGGVSPMPLMGKGLGGQSGTLMASILDN